MKDNLIIAIRGNIVCTEDRKDIPTFPVGKNQKKKKKQASQIYLEQISLSMR